MQTRYKLKSDLLTAEVDTLGSELVSLRDTREFEYLWQGSEDSWNRTSPILFPIIGGLPDNRYAVDGGSYEMSSHGFARNCTFDVVSAGDSSVTMKITETDETHSQYPFPFDLRVSHTLQDNFLRIDYAVKNTGVATMPFSIGGHPGFNCPIDPGCSFDDYYLRFNSKETVQRRLKGDNLLTGEKAPCLENSDILPLTHGLFAQGAVILDDLASTSVRLTADAGMHYVEMDFPGFTHFGIWQFAQGEPPFVCLEPWYGVDSTINSPSDFREKEGMIHLGPSEEFAASYTVRIGGLQT